MDHCYEFTHTHTHTAVAITGNEDFQLGELSRVRCSTPVPVESIQWLDESNRVVSEGTSVQELVLAVTSSCSSSNYACIVNDRGTKESRHISIRGTH